jgi:carbonic anhydrase
MQKLLRGIVEFRETQLHAYRERFAHLATGQTPDSLFIACSDSRVVPNLFASTDPGQLFVMRNVGNLMPEAHGSGHSIADESEAAAIEFSLGALGVGDIVVCGHSNCGAMKAALTGEIPPGMPNLTAWLRHAAPAVQRLAEKGPLDPDLPRSDQLSQWNVLVQLENIRTYPMVAERLAKGLLRLTALWFDVATGVVHAFDEETGKYKEICGAFAETLIARFRARAGS